jgi:hypothetical protein
LGGYTGIELIGGTSNFFVGNSNKTALNFSSYIAGNSNRLLNNSNTYIVGENNYAEKSKNSYVFGSNNSVSGSKNYVIGNNNTVRDGDYNSILIGVSHQFTGNNKKLSINLGVLENSIEINPSNINLTSVDRPTINNSPIALLSEANEALKVNDFISLSGIFQDPNFDHIATEIYLRPFTYSTGTQQVFQFSGAKGYSKADLSLPNFNIFSTNSYLISGKSGSKPFYAIYGNHTSPKFNPAWIIVDGLTSGVYQINSGYSPSLTPQSGWQMYSGSPTGYRAKSETSIDLSIGSRTGFLSVNHLSLGTIYLPYFY